jgi:hypothetical protein
METEKGRKLNILDIILTNQGNKTEFDIYRKLTARDHLMQQISCRPFEHKIADTKYLTHRMEAYNISDNNK